jgi:hypothetical protein
MVFRWRRRFASESVTMSRYKILSQRSPARRARRPVSAARCGTAVTRSVRSKILDPERTALSRRPQPAAAPGMGLRKREGQRRAGQRDPGPHLAGRARRARWPLRGTGGSDRPGRDHAGHRAATAGRPDQVNRVAAWLSWFRRHMTALLDHKYLAPLSKSRTSPGLSRHRPSVVASSGLLWRGVPDRLRGHCRAHLLGTPSRRGGHVVTSAGRRSSAGGCRARRARHGAPAEPRAARCMG